MGIKTTCPNPTCQGHNFYYTAHNSFGYCFNCGYWEKDGEQKSTEPRQMSPHVNEIRALYTQAANYYHTAIDTRAYTYLQQRGFNDSTIQELKIGYCPEGKSPIYRGAIAKDAGLATYEQTAFLADRITFPYFDDTGTVTDIRGRSMNPLDENKYKSLLGSSYYRGAIYPYNYQLRNKSKQVLYTEGEIKADIAYQHGYPTLASPGMMSWRDGLDTEEDIEYIMVFDNQAGEYYQIQRAIIKHAKKLHKKRVATLPLMGKKKQDIDGFILNYGKSAFDMVIRSALPFENWYKLQRF